MVGIIASGLSYSGFDSHCSAIFLDKKLSMLLRLVNGAPYRKVDSGLKMLIEII